MAAVFAPPEQVEELISAESSLSIAAYNAAHVVISGPETPLEAAVSRLAQGDVRCQRLQTSHAFHSQLMDPVLDEFEAISGQIAFQSAQRTLICNLTGNALSADEILDAGYWRNHARQPVQLAFCAPMPSRVGRRRSSPAAMN